MWNLVCSVELRRAAKNSFYLASGSLIFAAFGDRPAAPKLQK
ncbi:hypothetical protein BLL52_2037 [Rhodoferax antarcticus ANT.BR]|uniref:Uncharacterized protein n=1 Tax=Rhodoferax antarcticus ANT.BR TaxID=1111071 RepID=A0A1Q8YD32_9BURK|nr:hypothetical protein BLL52_2037 [Rhodoferax antarcticus ANT.BR]